MFQEQLIPLSSGRLLALTLDNMPDHEPPSRDLDRAYAFVGQASERRDCLELISEPLPADPAQAKTYEQYAKGQDVNARANAGKKLEAKTVQGQSLAVDATMGGVKVNNASVTTADIGASNGVIHVIDTVVLPK